MSGVTIIRHNKLSISISKCTKCWQVAIWSYLYVIFSRILEVHLYFASCIKKPWRTLNG